MSFRTPSSYVWASTPSSGISNNVGHTLQSLSTITLLLLTLCTSTFVFLLMHYSRDVSSSPDTDPKPRVYSLLTQTVFDQYQAFAELCNGLDHDNTSGSGTDQNPVVIDSGETDSAETPRAVRQEATDYFGPTMTRHRKSSASTITTSYNPSAPKLSSPAVVTSYFPPYNPSPSLQPEARPATSLSSPQIQSSLTSLDEMVFKWADSVVQALTPVLDVDRETIWRRASGVGGKMEDSDGNVGMSSSMVLREMYEVFRGEVANVMTS